MTRNEFLEKLKEALSGELDAYTIQNHLNYYDSYIIDEVNKGRTEADVLEELGDPWLIAKSLADAPSNTYSGQAYESYSNAEDYGSSSNYSGFPGHYGEDSHKIHIFGLDTWWKKLLLILGIAGIVFLLFAIISGIISLVAPIVVPVLVILLVVRFFQNRK